MKVSVIIPFYKGLVFLEDCMQSLMEQTYQDLEIILVCDRVEEDLEAFLEAYQSQGTIKVYHLKEKAGVAAARNLGLTMATGDYIYFLDSDDYLSYDAIEILVQKAEEGDSDLVYGKKSWTWLTRSLYLKNLYYAKGESEEDEEEDGESSDADQSMEKDSESDGDRNQKGSSVDLIQQQLQEQRDSAYYELFIRRKSLRSVTVLHVLMRRSLIIENNIRFNESILYLSDYPFLLQVLNTAKRFDKDLSAVYVKRNHTDSVELPALGQSKESKSFEEYVETYEYAKTILNREDRLRYLLDRKIVHYCIKYFAPQLRRSNNISLRNQKFDIVHGLVSQMDKTLLRTYGGYKRRILKAFYKGKLEKGIRIVNIHLAYRKLVKLVGNRRALARFLYDKLFLKQSLKENWVLCESFFGKSYSDSPKYIYEYLSKNYPGRYRFIWVIDKKNAKIPYKHTKIRRYGILYSYYYARCKYYVFNVRQPEWVKKRDGNVFLQTWHGTPLKRLVFDLEDVSSGTPNYKRQFYKQSRAWDYLVAPNQYSSDIFRRCFRFDKEMLETGYPRNDILHDAGKEQIAIKRKKTFGIPQDKKVILYAPTWRDDEYYNKVEYKFSLMLDLELMREKLGKDHVILLRTHYFIADSLDLSSLKGFAYDVSKYDDVSELYLISDYLITDYSSVFFDFANLKRPMLFYMYDLEKYRDILHGFYMDIEEDLPGPILFTTEEVIESIQNIDQITAQYQGKYEAFYEKFCSWEDGQASRKVVNKVFQLKG